MWVFFPIRREHSNHTRVRTKETSQRPSEQGGLGPLPSELCSEKMTRLRINPAAGSESNLPCILGCRQMQAIRSSFVLVVFWIFGAMNERKYTLDFMHKNAFTLVNYSAAWAVQWLAPLPHSKQVLGLNLLVDLGLSVWSLHILMSLRGFGVNESLR